jgi:hypothetical protein
MGASNLWAPSSKSLWALISKCHEQDFGANKLFHVVCRWLLLPPSLVRRAPGRETHWRHARTIPPKLGAFRWVSPQLLLTPEFQNKPLFGGHAENSGVSKLVASTICSSWRVDVLHWLSLGSCDRLTSGKSCLMDTPAVLRTVPYAQCLSNR